MLMRNINVNKIIKPINSSDGAGVKLKRSIGVEPNYFDPFLMLDEFGSDNKDDYVGGFQHIHIEGLRQLLTCFMENSNIKTVRALKEK